MKECFRCISNNKMLKKNIYTYLTRLTKDLLLSVKLLQREGIRAFISRIYWYLKGYRLVEDIPSGLSERKHKHFRKKKPLIFPNSDFPVVSIIIPVFNQWDYTYDCLHSILDHTQKVNYEVMIADDVSSDETRNLSKYAHNVRIIRNESNLGFLKNVNRAATFARGKYLFLLNNDTQVTENWLGPIVELMEKDAKVGLVGSKLIFANGKLQEAGGIIFQNGSGWNYGRMNNPDLPEFNYLKEVDYCSGAGICVRKDLWDRLGGFDERYAPAYYEDTDLAFAIRDIGYKVVYQPRSMIFHFEGISHGRDINSGVKKKQAENRLVFVEKWQKVLSEAHSAGPGELFTARDRSQGKKTLVMVDHYIPKPDQDAGSRSTYQYLMLFCQMGLNVKFIPDNFYKDEKYLDPLEQAGIEVLYGAHYRDSIFDWLKQNNQFIDFIYLSRPNISIKYIDFVKQHLRAKVIYQPHDLHFLRMTREYEVTRNLKALSDSVGWKKIESEIFKTADINLTFSTLEQTVIKESFNVQNCEVVPLFLYDKFESVLYEPDKREGILFVGGFNHPPNIDAVMWFLNDILPHVHFEIPDLIFHLVGSNIPESIINMKSTNILIHGYLTDPELYTIYQNVRLVVLPLRFGAGVKGKLLESMYFGVPLVATSIALEGIEGIQELLSPKDNARDFIDEIINIYQNQKYASDLSMSLRRFIEDHYSVQAGKLKLESILSRMSGLDLII